jgi:hypothetical protein
MNRLRFLRSPLRAIEQRLARARPTPNRDFAQRTERLLYSRWASMERPAALRAQVLGLAAVGVVLLIVALVIAVS